MNQFLPYGFEELKSSHSYWRMKEMEQGDNRLRIIQRPICGWIDWKENKPYRYRADEKPINSFNPDKPIRAFWTCNVWDYHRKALFILEITQNSILKTLSILGNDVEWGDFREYDIKINKSGNGKETKYMVTPLPHKKLDSSIQEAIKENPVNLDVLFKGGDPWNGSTSEKYYEKKSDTISFEQAKELYSLIGDNQEYIQNVLEYYKLDSLQKLSTDAYPLILERASRLSQEEQALPF